MTGTELITKERARQMSVEGWTPKHDDEHNEFQIARAAVAYAVRTINGPCEDVPAWWPWDDAYFKPSTAIRNLTKAGALIAAEIDRLQRERQRNTTGTDRSASTGTPADVSPEKGENPMSASDHQNTPRCWRCDGLKEVFGAWLDGIGPYWRPCPMCASVNGHARDL